MDKDADTTSHQRLGDPENRLGNQAHGTSKPPHNASSPKLGDFTSLNGSTTAFNPPHYFLSHLWPSDGGLNLGNLSKVVEQLRRVDGHRQSGSGSGSGSVQSACASQSTASSESDDAEPAPGTASSEAELVPLISHESEAPAPKAGGNEVRALTVARPRTMPSGGKDAFRAVEGHAKTTASKHHTARNQNKPASKDQMLREVLSYQLTKNGLMFPIYAKRRTIEATHESLLLKLISHCAMDSLVAREFPSNANHGLHVFLDMSNIDISFHKALRAKYNLADSARFTPLPRLNLQFLSQVLIRNRPVKCLSVGCSTAPGRAEPRYVQELRELGYRVDLRERRRVDDSMAANGPRRHSPFQDAPVMTTTSRYVEDLVDETLQTRIAEAVMEYFQEQGTIILATGDAKPAQYSDGFFMYAERALRMGWNVELVSWRASLSKAWTNESWTSQWKDRFRIIELDDLLDDLLASYI